MHKLSKLANYPRPTNGSSPLSTFSFYTPHFSFSPLSPYPPFSYPPCLPAHSSGIRVSNGKTKFYIVNSGINFLTRYHIGIFYAVYRKILVFFNVIYREIRFFYPCTGNSDFFFRTAFPPPPPVFLERLEELF